MEWQLGISKIMWDHIFELNIQNQTGSIKTIWDYTAPCFVLSTVTWNILGHVIHSWEILSPYTYWWTVFHIFTLILCLLPPPIICMCLSLVFESVFVVWLCCAVLKLCLLYNYVCPVTLYVVDIGQTFLVFLLVCWVTMNLLCLAVERKYREKARKRSTSIK